MSENISSSNYAIYGMLLIMTLYLFGVISLAYSYAVSEYISNDEPFKLNFNPAILATGLFDSGTSILNEANIKSNPGVYSIQIQSNSTVTDNQPGPINPDPVDSNSSPTQEEQGASSSESSETTSPSADAHSNTNPQPTTVKCEGSAICVMGEVVKVTNAKTLYINVQNKAYKVELALIDLPVTNEQMMRELTTYTRNGCLGSTALVDQDDGQREGSFLAQVYCSPTKNLNALLLNTGYVQLDKLQCESSEFSKLDWAKSHGC